MNSIEKLDLRPGDWVEVRSEAEVLATLNDEGMFESLPFMPEMLSHCGRRYQVYKRADKTCDTVCWTGLRRMANTVHLSMRCDGSAHGGCQAGCLLFWKEAWLRRSQAGEAQLSTGDETPSADKGPAKTARDRAWLEKTAYRNEDGQDEVRYRCQATELYNATGPLPWWQPGQYVRDVCNNDVPLTDVVCGVAIAAFSKIVRLLSGRSFPNVAGSLKRTPTESLGLQPGDWVVVKSKQEILATLDAKGCNRGMTFDSEMLPYCGRRCRVLRRVERLIEESTGRMIEPAGVSIILENVVCMSRYRRSCPRSIYPYWREIWLRRARSDDTPPSVCRDGPDQSRTNVLAP